MAISLYVLTETKKRKVKSKKDEFYIKANDSIKDDKLLAEICNKHYVNIAVRTFGSMPARIVKMDVNLQN